MIEINNLNKKIGENIILDNINFSVKRGEILGFLGPNGAGKSSTMKIITSFWQATSGEVKIDGIKVSENSIETRKKIGYLPETVPLYDDMTVYEYLKFIAEIRNISKKQLKERLKDVVAACGLKNVLKRPLEELSKGYRQRVGLAQAIMHNPEVLILDEPTTGLDPNQIAEIRDLIKKIGQEKTVIFSTHILGEVSAVCDRVIIINQGKIVGEGTPKELMENAGGREIIYAKIRGPYEQVIEKIKSLEEVVKIDLKEKEFENVYGYDIEPREGVDIREQLFKTIFNSNWGILEFFRKQISLEDVFRKLTK